MQWLHIKPHIIIRLEKFYLFKVHVANNIINIVYYVKIFY